MVKRCPKKGSEGMPQLILNIFLSASVISLALFVARTNPVLGGFIVSLPLSTLITLGFSKAQNQDLGNTFMLAKSIFVAVPATLLFFVPFLFAEKLKLSFWSSYFTGVVLLALSFFIHRWAMKVWF
jgi:hypothetical protein